MALSPGINWVVRTDGSDSACGGGSRAGAILARPSAPTVAAVNSGGSVAANTYYVVVTFRDIYGETQYSPETSVSPTGGSSVINVTSPTRPTNGYDWACYMGTVSGGPYFLTGSANQTFGTNFSRTTTPPTTGTQPPGTNYTNQAAAQVSYTDIVVDAVTNTKITSAAHPFVPDNNGSVLYFTNAGGFTPGYYEIQAVDASNVATLHASPAPVGTTGGNAYLGGALATPGWLYSKATGAPTYVNRNWAHIKSGTYVISTSVVGAAGPINCTSQMNTEGFGTTRGDMGTQPVIQSNTNSINIFNATGAGASNSILIRNITIDGNSKTSNRGIRLLGVYCIVMQCKIINCTSEGVDLSSSGGANLVSRCEFSNCTSANAAINMTSDDQVDNCYIHDAAANGIKVGTGVNIEGIRNVIFDTLAVGIAINTTGDTGSVDVINCSFYTMSGNAVTITSSPGPQFPRLRFMNCIFEAVSGIAISDGAIPTDNTWIENCAFYNNTTNLTYPRYVINPITLTGSPFTNAGSGDFSLNNTTGAGTLCRGAGVLGVFPGGLSVSGVDIGAVQSVVAAGGGQAAFVWGV